MTYQFAQPPEKTCTYMGDAKTYLHVEQDVGTHLLVLDVTDPNKISDVGER